MAFDLQEQEQLDELKAFWRRWGMAILVVLVVAALAFAGMRTWRWYQRGQADQAAATASTVTEAVTSGDPAGIQAAWQKLRDAHPKSIQASMGALQAAAGLMRAHKPEEAASVLSWLAQSGADTEYRLLGRLRLAGIQLDQHDGEQALQTLAAGDPKSSSADMDAAFADRRGDVLLALGRADEARKEYDRALKELSPSAPLRNLVQLKREALGQ